MCRGDKWWDKVGNACTSVRKDRQLAPKSASKHFTVNALAISAGSEYQNETARMLFAAASIIPLLVELIG